jgi:hypothetical protein
MVMARRSSGDWATPARLDAFPWSHPSPLSSFFQFLSSPTLAEGDYFLTVIASFPRRAGSESCGPGVRPESESHEPHVGGRSATVRLAQTGCGRGRDSRVGRVWP